MLSLPFLRADPADPLWVDADRVVTSMGTPGLAFGAALGLALAERLLAARFGRSLVDHRTWLIASAEELAAGPSHEAAAVAGAMALGRLAVVAAVPSSERSALARFTAVGWSVRRVEGGDQAGLEAAVSAALRAQKPTLVAVLGSADEAVGTVPLGAALLGSSPQGPGARRSWLKRLRRHASASAFQHAFSGALPPLLTAALAAPDGARPDSTKLAGSPLEAVHEALARLTPAMPELVVMPGILGAERIWNGRHHAAAGALLGMAMHGGLLPVCWFPKQAAHAMAPALSAAARLRVKLVQLVADGDASPLDAAVPVLRPGSAAEALDCLALALRWPGPAQMRLGSHAGPDARPVPGGAARGGYRAAGPAGAAVTLVAAGAELGLALAAGEVLAAQGIANAVAALPCLRLLGAQDADYQQDVLGQGTRLFLAPEGGEMWAGLTGGTGVYMEVTPTDDAASLAARIERRLPRSPAIPPCDQKRLESLPQFD